MTAEGFAVSVLRGIGAKPSKGAVKAMLGWMAAEGGHYHNDARFNPLNTTQPAPGAGNTGTQGNIKVYRSWEQGVKATVQTLKNGRYGSIIAAFKAGDPHAVAKAIDGSPWGTHGDLVYRTIAGAKVDGRAVDRAGRQLADTTKPMSREVTTPSVTLGSHSLASERVAAAMDLLHHKSSPLEFASAIQTIDSEEQAGQSVLPGKTFEVLTPAQKDAKKGQRAGGPGVTASGGWGGSEGIVSALDPVARQFGAPPTNHKRSPEQNAAVGGSPTSDHLTTNTNAYATDYAISGDAGVKLGMAIARKLGVQFAVNSYASGGTIRSNGHSYRVQILYGAGINHGDHVHVGVRKIS